MNRIDGMTYAPTYEAKPVVKPGEFIIAAIALDHGHIYGMCNGLVEAGAELKWVYDPDEEKVRAFIAKYPGVRAAESMDEIMEDPEVRLVAAAAIPSERGPLGNKVMAHGKDYFTDKTPLQHLNNWMMLELWSQQPIRSIWFTIVSVFMLKAQSMRDS